MRIAYITQKFPPHELGGADLVTYDLARSIRTIGNSPFVICVDEIDDEALSRGQILERYDVYDDIPVWRLSFNWKSMPDPYWSLYGINFAIENIIISLLKQIQPDLIHVTSCSMITAAALTAPQKLGLPIVFTLTGKWELCPIGTLLKREGTICRGRQSGITCLQCMFGNTKTVRILTLSPNRLIQLIRQSLLKLPFAFRLYPALNFIRAIERRDSEIDRILKKIDIVLSPSQCHIDIFSQSGFISNRRIILSPHGRDIANNKLGAIKTRSKRIRVGYTGQIVPHKGVDTLIHAFNRLPQNHQLELHIFGDPTKDPACEGIKSLAGNNTNIFWRGPYKYSDVGYIMSTIDIVAVPSNCVENDPGTIAEAFAAKTPVIGSDTCGVIEHIRHNIDGLIFRRNDPEDLAKQLLRISEEPGLVEQLRAGILTPRSLEEEALFMNTIYSRVVHREPV